MSSYGKGADLEGTALEWLEDVRTLENRGIRRTGAILAVSANEMLGRLEGSYKRLIDSNGGEYRYTAQQQSARVNAIAEKAGDFINPATRRQIVELQTQDLAKAQRMGNQAGLDLEKIINDRSKTLQQNAKPNMPAIDAAGKRLADFWSKENTSFRDRVRALTQVGAAQGLSYRKLANQVRELLVLEQKSGTESKRSQRINKKLGIQSRAELIARTEIQTAYVQGQIDQARKNGFDWGRWSAGAERTCGFCISRHGMVYEMDDIEGQIPAHPRCRCTVIPVEAPEGWKKGQKIDPKTAELDDEFWTNARASQIKEWKKDQNTNRRGEQKPKESLKSNSELDQAIRRYLNTPTNTQQYLLPGSDAPAPLWKPSGNTIPDQAAAAQIQADAIAAANAAIKPGAPKPKVEADIIPDAITAAGLDEVWKDMSGNPAARKQLLDGITKKSAAATAKKQADAAKAKQKKEADAAKKQDAEIKASKAKQDAIDGLKKLGVSAAGAEQVWRLTQMYRGQGMSPEAATTKAIQDMAAGKGRGKGKPSELQKSASQRNSRKQVMQEKGHGKVNQNHLGEVWEMMATQQGQAGQNWNQLQKFAERHNISNLWGTGGKSKGMQSLAKNSKAIKNSLQSAAARRDTDWDWQRTALNQIKQHQTNDGILRVTPNLDRAITIKGTAGVNGSTQRGYGFVKVRLDAQSKAIDAGMLKRMQAQVTKNIEAAGKGDLSHWNAGARLDTYRKQSGKYLHEKSDSSWLHTYVHEMGHQVHYMAGSPRFRGKYNPSKYGTTNKEEWFAETFLQYTVAPEALRKAAPDAYKFVDKVVKQVMDPASKPGQMIRDQRAKTQNPDKFFNEMNSTQRKKSALEALEVAPKVKAQPNYAAMTATQLKAAAKAAGLKGYSKMNKADLYTAVSGQKVGFEAVKAADVAKKAAAKAKKDLAAAKAGKLPKPTTKPAPAKAPAAKPKTVTELKAAAKAQGVKGYSKMKKADLEAALTQKAAAAAKPAGIKSTPAPKAKPKATATPKAEPKPKAGVKKTQPKKVAAQTDPDFDLVSTQLGLSKTQWDKKSPTAKKLALKTAAKKQANNAGKSLAELKAQVKAAQAKADAAKAAYEKTISDIAANKGKLKAKALETGKGSGDAAKTGRIKELSQEIAKLSKKAFDGTFTAADKAKVQSMQAERDTLQKQLDAKNAKPKKPLPKTTDDIDFQPDPSDFEQYGFKSERAMDELFETVDHWSGNGYKNIRKQQISTAKKSTLTEYEKGMVERYKKAKDADWEEDRRMARDLETFLKNAPKYKGEVQRGQFVDNAAAAEALIKQLNGGRSSLALESWTNDPTTANNFATGKDTGRPFKKGNIGLVFKMQNKHGSPIASMSGLGHENEVLMPSGIKTKIKKVTKKTVKGKEVWEIDLISA